MNWSLTILSLASLDATWVDCPLVTDHSPVTRRDFLLGKSLGTSASDTTREKEAGTLHRGF